MINELLDRLAEHLLIAFSATFLALVIGLLAGIWIYRQSKLRGPVLSVANILQTIPSLALLAIFVPLLGIGFKPTITTLTVYALLPIVRNTYVGLKGISDKYIEVANAIGMTAWQKLHLIEIPLALPVILSGLRVATTMTIGITTIAAFIGAGGLGNFIVSGLSLGNSRLVLLGAIPTALLALATDSVISYSETRLTSRKKAHSKLKACGALATALLLIAIIAWQGVRQFIQPGRQNSIVIASKNFTEQYILADIMAELIEKNTRLHVIKKFNLPTTPMLLAAMRRGDIDLYPEYTGTAYWIVLKKQDLLSPQATFDAVKQAYRNQYNQIWLAPFGFSNAQTLAVNSAFAKQHGVYNLSDLANHAKRLTIAAPAEFIKREDGYPLLAKQYGLHFKQVLQMEPTLMLKALAKKSIQIAAVFTTDARLKKFNLTALHDDRQTYPPYFAAPVIRRAVLQKHPELNKLLNKLASQIDQETMTRLNYLVDVKKQSPEAVAHYFLANTIH